MNRMLLPISAAAAVALATSFAAVLPVAAQDSEAGVTRHYFNTSDGLRLHYARLGDSGTPVILIHGSGGMAQTWLDNGIAHALAANHIVIAADMRGHGRSQGPREGDMALDVVELMDVLGFERAHIHGFSMGGSITAQLMARIPDRVITAAFGGSGVRETEEWADRVPVDAEGDDPYDAEVMRMYRERREAARAAFGGVEADNAPPPADVSDVERPGPGPAELDLTTIDFPVLAIVGEFDGHKERTHRLWRELRNFQSIMLPGRGHLSSYYPGVIPAEYTEGLLTFINSHDEAP